MFKVLNLYRLQDKFANMLQDFKDLFWTLIDLTFGYFFNLEKRIHWFYIFTSIILAYYVFKSLKGQKELDQKSSFFSYVFKKENYLSSSALTDYSFLLFNAFVKVFLIGSFAYISRSYQFELTEWLQESFGLIKVDYSILWLIFIYTISLLIIGDFSYYLLHLIYHKVPFLWAFHKVHHSSTALNPITQYRIHPVELILNNLRYIFVLTFLNGVFDYLSNGYYGPKTYLGVNVLLLAFNSWGANLRHSHIKLTYFNWLENWLISPYQHQIHHSSQKHLFDKNLGSKLAIWDKFFGTLIKSKEVENLEVGLGEENSKYDTFLKNLLRPFYEFFKVK